VIRALHETKCVCSAWEVHVVLRHVGTQTGNQNEKTASSGKAKEVEKGRYSAVREKQPE
jgi:hypothetical protein